MQEELEELEKTDKVSSALQEYVPPLEKIDQSHYFAAYALKAFFMWLLVGD